MSFAPPPETTIRMPTPPPQLQDEVRPKVRPLPPIPRNDARASAEAAPSLENGSYLAMEDLLTATAAMPVGESRA
jgi:hypothetical protein